MATTPVKFAVKYLKSLTIKDLKPNISYDGLIKAGFVGGLVGSLYGGHLAKKSPDKFNVFTKAQFIGIHIGLTWPISLPAALIYISWIKYRNSTN